MTSNIELHYENSELRLTLAVGPDVAMVLLEDPATHVRSAGAIPRVDVERFASHPSTLDRWFKVARSHVVYGLLTADDPKNPEGVDVMFVGSTKFKKRLFAPTPGVSVPLKDLHPWLVP